MANRLNLNFKLDSAEERLEYVHDYLNPDYTGEKVSTYSTQKYPFPFPHTPTPDELETMANYVLYGKTVPDEYFDLKENGSQSVVDAKYVEINVKGSPWNRKKEGSLEGMVEEASETGNPIETQYVFLSDVRGKREPLPHYRTPKEVFSRSDTRRLLRNDARLLSEYERLWKSIDMTEYTVTSYALMRGRRTLPIREELTNRLTDYERAEAIEDAKKLNMYTWSKLRRRLVELRTQQYYLRDSFAPTIGRPRPKRFASYVDSALRFEQVLPCGVVNVKGKRSLLTFFTTLNDTHFTTEYLTYLNTYLSTYSNTYSFAFDFRDLDHVAALVYATDAFASLDDEEAIEDREYIEQLYDTLAYYVRSAKLEPLHEDIIRMKAEGLTNGTIANYVNSTYNKTYSPNYISTIFRSKCCRAVNVAAELHLRTLENLLKGREGFKKCNTCGELLLKTTDNYVRKARSSDGLTGRCKRCDKALRGVRK